MTNNDLVLILIVIGILLLFNEFGDNDNNKFNPELT